MLCQSAVAFFNGRRLAVTDREDTNRYDCRTCNVDCTGGLALCRGGAMGAKTCPRKMMYKWPELISKFYWILKCDLLSLLPLFVPWSATYLNPHSHLHIQTICHVLVIPANSSRFRPGTLSPTASVLQQSKAAFRIFCSRVRHCQGMQVRDFFTLPSLNQVSL